MNIVTKPEDVMRARFKKYRRRKFKPLNKRKSVWTISGGAPTLGKRR